MRRFTRFNKLMSKMVEMLVRWYQSSEPVSRKWRLNEEKKASMQSWKRNLCVYSQPKVTQKLTPKCMFHQAKTALENEYENIKIGRSSQTHDIWYVSLTGKFFKTKQNNKHRAEQRNQNTLESCNGNKTSRRPRNSFSWFWMKVNLWAWTRHLICGSE